jgi:broad specificity phosphatase PhoE
MLYLIRHGQASFMQSNYDRLSELGVQQATLLGEHLSEKGFSFDASLMGTLDRHHGTYQTVRAVYLQKGLDFPEAKVVVGLNEHQAAEIHGNQLPAILSRPEYHFLKSMYDAEGGKHPEVRKQFLKMFLEVTMDWAKGDIDVMGYESFQEFKARVRAGNALLLSEMEGKKKVIAFSSGGTIAMLIGFLLDLDDLKVIELNWQIRNASITEFSYSKGRFYLRGFNFVPHLPDEKLITYV